MSLIFCFGCSSVPLNLPKINSATITDTANTELGKLAANWKKVNGEKSGFLPLPQGMDGLGARLELAEKAEKSIDLQYFMMKDDTAGTVILDALLKAADRGVRIRFLLDDIFTTEPDSKLHMLDQHPNIEVRLFNPISRHGIYALNFAAHFSQANRRMHNKSFTVDYSASIIGGRNIADEYFQLDKSVSFEDFDILAIGPISHDISASFNQYWNHDLSISIAQLSTAKKSKELVVERKKIRLNADKIYAGIYKEVLKKNILQTVINDPSILYAANARVLSDTPDKLEHKVSKQYMRLVTELNEVLKTAKEEILFITPYYIPSSEDVQLLPALIESGINVTVLTNSLASTNHVSVYSAYADHRLDVINAGIELYEVRANAGREAADGKGPDTLTLHTKLILIDKRYLFVGSLNLDPRSFQINTQMGVLIDSKELTGKMATAIKKKIPDIAYHLVKDEQDQLTWHGVVNGKKIVETKEPLTSTWLRFKAWVMKIAPEDEL